ncbi:hypothetical protein [Moorena producens]|uniref:hypothetical protein n=1 Tax=Moorena producens TaxID=1155739 RepID=UPI001314B858|nr:hypothetical protein [Moorena producens]
MRYAHAARTAISLCATRTLREQPSAISQLTLAYWPCVRIQPINLWEGLGVGSCSQIRCSQIRCSQIRCSLLPAPCSQIRCSLFPVIDMGDE